LKNGTETTWSEVDGDIKKSLQAIKAKNGKITIVSNTIVSPSTLGVIEDFTSEFGNVEHIQYDAVSYSGIRQANMESFGMEVIPSYDFAKADTIVSVGADFLNGWLLSNAYSVAYGANRKPESGKMSKHFQFEANMSLAGANADHRGMVKPSQYAAVLAAIAEGIGAGSVTGVDTSAVKDMEAVKEAIASLKANKGKSLVICGSNNKALQIITNKINHALGNYDTTIRVDTQWPEADSLPHQTIIENSTPRWPMAFSKSCRLSPASAENTGSQQTACTPRGVICTVPAAMAGTASDSTLTPICISRRPLTGPVALAFSPLR
jgi:molybdopterin-containing oxidoreductase family iron-sulfur binding subunit